MNSKVLQLKKIEESITYGVRTPTFRKKKTPISYYMGIKKYRLCS